MDKQTKPNEPTPVMPANGMYLRGVVVSNRAKAFNRKDGSGVGVVIEYEIALQPGVAIWQRFLDPKKDLGVKVEGEVVTEFPRMKEFETVTVKATRVRSDEHTGQIVIKAGELVA